MQNEMIENMKRKYLKLPKWATPKALSIRHWKDKAIDINTRNIKKKIEVLLNDIMIVDFHITDTALYFDHVFNEANFRERFFNIHRLEVNNE